MQTSIKQFLKQEILSSRNRWFCPSCSVLSESTKETCIINSAPILIIQFCRFSNQGDQLMKDANFFSCTHSESNKHLAVPITVEDEVSFTNKYSLIAIINHSGTLNRGHYWAFIEVLHLSSWYCCNDKLVFNVGENSLNNSTSYTSFFTTKFKCSSGSPKNFHTFASGFCHIVFGCDDPTYNPSPLQNWVCSLSFQALQPCSP